MSEYYFCLAWNITEMESHVMHSLCLAFFHWAHTFEFQPHCLHYGSHKDVLLRTQAAGNVTDQRPGCCALSSPRWSWLRSYVFQAAPSWGLLCRDSKVALSCEKQDSLTISFGSRMPYWPGQNLLRTLPLSKMLLTQSSFFSFLLHKSHLLTLACSSNPPIFLWRCFHQEVFHCCLFIYFKYLFILAALGLPCCARAFFSCSQWGPVSSCCGGILIEVTSLYAEHGL